MSNKVSAGTPDLNALLKQDLGKTTSIFTPDHVSELHGLFTHYADPRQKRADVRDVLMTAKTLGLDQKYELVYRLLGDIHTSTNGSPLNFQQFFKEINNRVGQPFSEEGRRNNFKLLDREGKGELNIDDLRYMNEQFKYGYTEEQLHEIIHSVGGYGAETITEDQFNKFISKKVEKRKLLG